MIKFRHLLLLGSVALLTAGCKMDRMGVMDPKGLIAADERLLIFTSFALMLLVVIPVILLTFYFAWKYRASNTKAKYSPEFAHSTVLEVVWWTIPIIIIAILGTITWITSHRYDPYRPLNVNTKPIVIQVVAMNWKWLFIYPDQNIASVNFVQFPVNVPVRFYITADAPMNSFQIPQLAGQIYAMAGMRTELNLMATHNGDYAGLSTNYSGIGFAGMMFTARATSQADFDAWVKSVQQSKSNQRLSKEAYKQLEQPSENNPVATYSSVTNDLFNNVIMSYMMPMPATPPIETSATSTKRVPQSKELSQPLKTLAPSEPKKVNS
ncbi:MAG TPA: ubiquinol oxidase subunit II [Gammaproteobacteria bacterium]|nr:ubiquinol oxidase subunit II [Gammaproteobacteria bacterium]